ncbi:MAG TPA: ABC transporter permease [Rhodothermales bacterium]
MTDASNHVEARLQNEVLIVTLAGRWMLADGVPAYDWRLLFEEEQPASVRFETRELKQWDSSLVAFVLRLVNWAEKQGISVDPDGLPDNILNLLELATSVSNQSRGDSEPSDSPVARVGNRAIARATTANEALSFLGETAISVGRLLTGRSRMRGREFWTVIQDAGPSALPIVTLISFLVGLILAFLGTTVLAQFGAGIYTAHLVGFGMLRELGAMMTAIIMVGRTGASFAASIGTMRVGEELDAFQTLGVPISDYIVLPRLLALSLMMPLLTLYADVIGIGGGMLVSVTMQDVTPRLFLNTLIGAVHLNDFVVGIVKGAVFGVLIAITGCLRGIQCGSNAEAVGKATTSAVVTGTTLVILSNAIIDWLETLG